MKKYILIIMTFVIALSTQVTFGAESTKQPDLPALKKQHYPSEKAAAIKQAAVKVANEMAPYLDTKNLVPVIFNDPISGKYGAEITKKTIRVLFMKDEDDYRNIETLDIDPVTKRPNGKSTIRKRPNSKLAVVLFEDSLEPFNILDEHNRGITFLPDYKTFRKNNPNIQLKPFTPPSGENVLY